MSDCKKCVAIFFALLMGLGLSGCTSMGDGLGYYWQSINGHWAVMRAAKPISEWLNDDATPKALKEKLALVKQIRGFASSNLGLPDNGSYTKYADLKRPSVVWNVFATPELSIKLQTWCFPVAGCVSYKGFYAQADAENYAQQLRGQGLEAYVGGVPAYSTLGWFDDPVLNTFINYPDGELARLIFHELGHQILYVKNDSTFNESFATAIEEEGLARWLKSLSNASERERLESQYREFSARKSEFVALLKRSRAALEGVYARPSSDQEKRLGKAAVFEQLQANYIELKKSWGGYAGYDRWFAQKLTNAHLASVATYSDGVPGFKKLLHEEGGDLSRYYAAAKKLSELDKPIRDKALGIQAIIGSK